MHNERSMIERRVARILAERIRPAVYGARSPLSVAVWESSAGGAVHTPPAWSDAVAAPYEPCSADRAWGAPWTTTWFRFQGQVPADWRGSEVEARIDLGFVLDRPGFSCEGLVYDADGAALKGLSPRNSYVPITAGPGDDVTLYVEAAANPELGDGFRPTILGDPETAGDALLFRLRRAELAVRRPDVWSLAISVEFLLGVAAELPGDEPRQSRILHALSRAVSALDLDDIAGTAAPASKELADVLAQPAAASAHRVAAVGNAHIDSAWLWPLRETHRKVARTVANALALGVTEPDYVFAFSQAQQLDWLRHDHPALFEGVRRAVAEGQIVPVGGLWVEPDGNLPGGEAMTRHLIYGKRFFLEHFGVETEEVWMPDSFGYSAALPQLARLAGNRWMLTQKLSWNDTNRFPHHTFWWEGIDGSRIFTHFPPVDTYNSELAPSELARATRQYREHGAGTRSLVPFGYGDGGGGPTREMMARARLAADFEGMPRVAIEAPRRFFAQAEAEYPDAPVWSGELYLELHRGVLTTQARSKAANRRCEHLLHEAELWAATAAVRADTTYPHDDLERLWKQVLLLQFHDILPGTSIAWVHHDSEQMYADITAELETLIAASLSALVPTTPAGNDTATVLFNGAPHDRDGVPAMGAGRPTAETAPAVIVTAGERTVLDNSMVRVVVDADGLVTSIRDLEADREILAPGAIGNLLQLHPDFPSHWDAWDIDRSYRDHHVDLLAAEQVTVEATDPASGAVRVLRRFGRSRIEQILRVRAGSKAIEIETDIDWHEQEKLLKAAFPLDVHADRAASEIQFGHLFRPTHTNTSWDAARFETVAHRWVHIGEAGYGVAVTSTATYGHDVGRSTRPDGGTTTTLRLSLLRGPRFPDPAADQGAHRFTYVLHPGATIADAVVAGYRINLPPRAVVGAVGAVLPPPLVRSDNPAIVVETVKAADDRSGGIVVRCYEAWGGQAGGRLTINFPHLTVEEVDLLERSSAQPSRAIRAQEDGCVHLRLRPFQLLTLAIR